MARPLFSPRSVALMERLNEASLPDSCTVEVPGDAVPDGEGGSFVKWEAIGGPVPCRVSPIGTPVERISGGQFQQFARYTVVFATLTQLPPTSRLLIAMEGGTLLLAPQGSNGPRSYEAQRKFECTLWKGREDEEPEGS